MSLDNIQLPALVIADLFKNVLVDLKIDEQQLQNQKKASFAYLGNHTKHICIVVNDENAVYLNEEELSFLLGILTACKFSMADVAVVNKHKSNVHYTSIKEELMSQFVLLFGVKPADIQLPLEFPYYQIQKYNNQNYLFAPSLSELMNNKEEKSKLWNTLKILFSLG